MSIPTKSSNIKMSISIFYILLLMWAALGHATVPSFTAGDIAPFCLEYDELHDSMKVNNNKYTYFYRWCDQPFNDTLIKPGTYNKSNKSFYTKNNGNAEGHGLYMTTEMEKSIGYGPHIMEIICLNNDVGQKSKDQKQIYLYSTSDKWYVAKQFHNIWFRPFYGSSYTDSDIYRIAHANGYNSKQTETIEKALVRRKTDFMWIIYKEQLQCYHDFSERMNPFRQQSNKPKKGLIPKSKFNRDKSTRNFNSNTIEQFIYEQRTFEAIPNELCPLYAKLTVFNYDFYTSVHNDLD